jgi:hypothetical protein
MRSVEHRGYCEFQKMNRCIRGERVFCDNTSSSLSDRIC